MTVAERLHSETMGHLANARQTMNQLMACTADWSAGVQVEIDFRALEDSCREFGRCQFGLNVDRKMPPPLHWIKSEKR
jgi:hypothetical protein